MSGKVHERNSVLHICLSSAWGGLEMQSHRWTKHFVSRGINAVCVAREGTSLAKDLKDQGTPHFLVKGGKYFSPTTTRQIKKIVEKIQPSSIVFHHLKDLWLVIPALRSLSGIRKVGFARMFLKKHPKKGFLHRYLYGQLDKMIHISLNQKKYLLKCLPVKEERYEFVPNGIDTKAFHPDNRSLNLHKELSLDSDALIIGLIGRLDPQKGQKETIEGFLKLINVFPDKKLHLVIIGERTAGEYEDYERELKQLASKSQSNIHLLGYRSDVRELVADLDIFVLASYEETFGNVVLEALASGVATIVTQSGGAQEIIIEDESGLYIQPRSSNSIFEVLKRVVDSPEKLNLLKKNGRKRAEKFYEIENIKDKVIEIVCH